MELSDVVGNTKLSDVGSEPTLDHVDTRARNKTALSATPFSLTRPEFRGWFSSGRWAIELR